MEAMINLEQLPCGAIGGEGPTLHELDKFATEHGRNWEDDAMYHIGQRAWRILEAAFCKTDETKGEKL